MSRARACSEPAEPLAGQHHTDDEEQLIEASRWPSEQGVISSRMTARPSAKGSDPPTALPTRTCRWPELRRAHPPTPIPNHAVDRHLAGPDVTVAPGTHPIWHARKVRSAILMFDGVDELDAMGPYEVLAATGRRGGDVSVAYVSATGAPRVTAGYGTELSVKDQLALDDLDDLDVLVVPGGGWAARAPAGAWAEIGKGELPRLLASAPRPGLTIAAVCTGVMLLSAAGLTAGRPCVTHRAALAALAAEGGRVIDARVVDDGDLVTCGGVTAGIDLALWLVERELGADLAESVAYGIEYERTGTVWRAGTQD